MRIFCLSLVCCALSACVTTEPPADVKAVEKVNMKDRELSYDQYDETLYEKPHEAETELAASEKQTEKSVDPAAPKEPELPSFVMGEGKLEPQINKFITFRLGAPRIVWELDKNLSWWGKATITGETNKHILAKILAPYDARAYFYDNNIVVIKPESE
jgi:hypothetical protein